ncbi:MAG: AAA family ATPase [Proteobacteria bacterium]|nr:AAA family ATPase [Pseudomonadota bacterium]
MFEDFYHLTQNPFQINTDPRFLWLGEKHKEALAILQYGVLGNKSFLLLTGDVGTGKTTLINALLKGQGSDTLIATIQDPDLSTLELYNYIAYAFGVQDRFDTKGEFLESFRRFLEKNYYSGKKVLLVIDEAQRTKQNILEDIRCLSNIEVDGNKLINIFFVGQNEFNDILLQDENKAIRQRITISYNIKPLTCSEVAKYIQFRLFKAGAKGAIFKKDAVEEIYKYTHGYPRLINILCDRCLLTGFVRGEKTIGRKTVKECCAEVDISLQADIARQDVHREINHKKQHPYPWRLFLQKRYLLFGLAIMLLGLGWFFSDELARMLSTHSSSAVSVQETSISPLVSSVPPSVNSSGENGAKQGLWNEMAHIVLSALGQKENQDPGEVLHPSSSSDKGGIVAPATVSEPTNKAKSTISPLPSSDRKMQIYFQSDSISPAPEYIEGLKVFSERFMNIDGGRIVIRGYTDRSGTPLYNKKLAKFRADIVKTFLEGRGVDVAQITTFGVISESSSEEAISFPQTGGGMRRVELEIILPVSNE